MKKIYIKWGALIAAMMGLFITSCSNEEWDRHYNNTEYILSDFTLSDYIKSQPDMETFYSMMEISGYDSLLNGSQTYTVWVPSDSSLQGIDLTDTSSVREIVENHIARFNQPTSGLVSDKVYMLSKKFVVFSKATEGYYFGSCPLTGMNVAANNGIIHSIAGYELYAPNVWEYLTRIQDISSLYAYFQSLIVTDEYDEEYNTIFSEYAALDDEDSTYTVLLPTNNAWADAIEKIKAYYITHDKEGGEESQLTYTKRAVINNLFFSGVSNPYLSDTVKSTTNNFFDVNKLFAGATSYKASNGALYVTDSLRMDARESWHQEIRIEAENTDYGREKINCNIYFRNSEGTGFDASGGRYITMDPTVSNDVSDISAIFPLPNTLSAKYNLYVVFMPERIVNSTNPKPNKASFLIVYRKSNGTVATSYSKLASSITTSADTITKVFVSQITFPYCNMYDGTTESINVKLRVNNAAKRAETTTFSRTMRIDCIILEPVD